MKKKMDKERIKKMISILILILLLMISILFISNFVAKEVVQNAKQKEYFEIMPDGSKRNTSERLAEMKFVNEIKVSDITLIYDQNKTCLSMILTNTSNETKGGFEAIIKVKDSELETKAMFKEFIPKIKTGESEVINIESEEDLTNAYTFEIEEYPGYEEIIIDGAPQKIDIFAQ